MSDGADGRDDGRSLLSLYRHSAQGACALVYFSGKAMTAVEILVFLECCRYKGARTFLALVDVFQFLTLMLLRRQEIVAE